MNVGEGAVALPSLLAFYFRVRALVNFAVREPGTGYVVYSLV